MDERMRASFIKAMQARMASPSKGNEMLDQAIKDHNLLIAIQLLLNGKHWTVETIEQVAKLLDENGYPIGEP